MKGFLVVLISFLLMVDFSYPQPADVTTKKGGNLTPTLTPIELSNLERLKGEIDELEAYTNENEFQEIKKQLQRKDYNPQVEKKSSTIINDRGVDSTSLFEVFVGNNIKQFGYDFFRKSPSSFIPPQNIPVTPDYVIGPGDEIIINIWGRINARWVVEVSRDGTISLPKIGVVNCSGIAFKDLRDFLKREISRYYTDFELNVSMGNLRSIRVYLVGNVLKPGAYTLPALSTLISALFDSGGPSKVGSMRRIELRRDGKTITTLDLYDFLIKGDKAKDIKLLNEDTIFVPPVGSLVAIVNGVKKPAIYELKEGERLLDLINLAGGFSNVTYNKKVSIKRVFDQRYTDWMSFDIDGLDESSSKNIVLKDGDIISFDLIAEEDTQISIYGAVLYPGKIGIKQGKTTLLDVINLCGGLTINASNIAEITRFHKTDNGVITERFEVDLNKVFQNDPKDNVELKEYDSIYIRSIPNWYTPRVVEVSGEVQSPGMFTIEKGEKLSSVLQRAGGFTDKAYPKGIVFIRESVRKQQQKNIDEIVERLERELLTQSSQEISSSLSQEETQIKKAVLEQKKEFVRKIKGLKATGRVYIKLESIQELKNSPYDIELEDGDKIFIPTKPSVVNVAGAVMAGGSYIYSSSSYKDYIKMAGGYSSYADRSRIFILKYDGRAIKVRDNILFSSKVEPGDTIVVPERFESIAWLREIRDITQIITNLALSTGVIIKVF